MFVLRESHLGQALLHPERIFKFALTLPITRVRASSARLLRPELTTHFAGKVFVSTHDAIQLRSHF